MVARSALLPAAGALLFGTVGVASVEPRTVLFVDRHHIDRLSGASLRLHSPEPREVALRFDSPWEGPESGYVTVMRAHDGFRMVYKAGGEITPEVTCLAVSSDGQVWDKPKLGLYEHGGSKANNIMFVGQERGYWESHNFAPFLDTNPAAAPDARYKAVALGRSYPPQTPDRQKALVVLGSADGIRWRHLSDKAAITDGSFDSQYTAFWDPNRREYVCYIRDGRNGIRSIKRSTSQDFLHWTPPVWLDFGPGPHEQFYTNAITLYASEPSLFLAFPMRFVPERRTVGSGRRPTDGLSDAVFLTSRDGLRFERPVWEAFLRPGRSPANWGSAHANNTPAWGILHTAADELSLYWCENYGSTPHVRRGVLRLDGFVSVHADARGGELLTRPILCSGPALRANYATSAAGSLRGEVQGADGRPLPGLAMAESVEVFGDEISGQVTWARGRDLSRYVGKEVRLRIALRDADLYSLSFSD